MKVDGSLVTVATITSYLTATAYWLKTNICFVHRVCGSEIKAGVSTCVCFLLSGIPSGKTQWLFDLTASAGISEDSITRVRVDAGC